MRLSPGVSRSAYNEFMREFVLEERLRTGIHEIDAAHERLLTGLSDLVQAVRTDYAAKHIEEFVRLMDYLATEHFQDEECAMLRTGYPALLPHRIQHQALKAEFDLLVEQYAKSDHDGEIVVRLGNFMASWMSDHMYKYDLHMAKWLQNVPAIQSRLEA